MFGMTEGMNCFSLKIHQVQNYLLVRECFVQFVVVFYGFLTEQTVWFSFLVSNCFGQCLLQVYTGPILNCSILPVTSPGTADR